MGGRSSRHEASLSGKYRPVCSQQSASDDANAKYKLPRTEKLPEVHDDVISHSCPLGEEQLVACGVDGWIYAYNWEAPCLTWDFRAHRKATNRIVALNANSLLTASADTTVRLWDVRNVPGVDTEEEFKPLLSFLGHQMSVSALDVVGGNNSESDALFTGSRDCSVRVWDLHTGMQIHAYKTLRNVVTAVRRVPRESHMVVQASEDLQLRLWDVSVGTKPVHAVHAGPNQVVCVDVSDDGNYVACGTKGFSRENCELKVFDMRAGLKELSSVACADYTVEAVHMVEGGTCLTASKDGWLRSVSVWPTKVLREFGHSMCSYTALGVSRRVSLGPVALTASVGQEDHDKVIARMVCE